MTRVPLLSGGRLVVVETGADGVVLRPPAPPRPIRDVGAAVREALRFPLAGPPLESLVTRGGSATVVIEHPLLPIPSASPDPRHEAIEATVDELERLGVAQVTILVAGGLGRRLSPREIGLLVPAPFRRRFRGRVIVHDTAADDLVDLGHARVPLRVAPALVETDLVVCVTAAETALHGGPSAFLRACSYEAQRVGAAPSLLEAGGSPGLELARDLDRLLSARVPAFGVSLVLNLPHVFGGYPYEDDLLERIARSRLRRGFSLLPAPIRATLVDRLPRELSVAAVYGGSVSAAHTEALLRGVEFKGAVLDEPLDAIVIGIPPTTLTFPRERPNPVSAAYLGLGLALRMWRDGFPVKENGTAILLHDLQRRFPRPSQTPYRSLFSDHRGARDPNALRDAEADALADPHAIAAYRDGRSVHPLAPFGEWRACLSTADRLGAVVVAGCRDASSARQLGLVPAHGISAALAMAEGRGAERIGFLLSPPYFPLRVGS